MFTSEVNMFQGVVTQPFFPLPWECVTCQVSVLKDKQHAKEKPRVLTEGSHPSILAWLVKSTSSTTESRRDAS